MKPQDINILVGCEESRAVCKAFRARGFNAFSCDIQECSGGHPEWHIKRDVLFELWAGKYHVLIGFPPCYKISRAGARWMYPQKGIVSKKRLKEAMEAKTFF